MATFTHKNGNTYNVTVLNGIVYLSSENNCIEPMQITLENFNKLDQNITKIIVKAISARAKANVGKVIILNVERIIRNVNYGYDMVYGSTTLNKINYRFSVSIEDEEGIKGVCLTKVGSANGKPVWFDKVEVVK